MKSSLVTILIFFSIPINAHDYHSSYKENNRCYGEIYREKYIPGTIEKPGYVRKWEETIRIPCNDHKILSSKVEFERNDYQKNIKNQLIEIKKWINSRFADWKSNEHKNY